MRYTNRHEEKKKKPKKLLSFKMQVYMVRRGRKVQRSLDRFFGRILREPTVWR